MAVRLYNRRKVPTTPTLFAQGAEARRSEPKKASRGRGTGFAGPQAQRPRGAGACLRRLGQTTEAKRLASRGLQGLAYYTQPKAE